ncbi:MAG: zinc-binding dehydrogenase, partial [bacterium]|nr:zinc-binding dehydrogenase [bacterium]
DLVSWSIAASCGACFYCSRDLPQKCESLRKYGHHCIHDGQPLSGGYAEHVYLFPGTSIFKVPAGVPIEVAAPANCALSTVIYAADKVGIEPGESVLIQGAGLLGLNLVALAREAGAATVMVADVNARRLDLARAFGVDTCFDPTEEGDEAVLQRVREATGGHGVDVAFEVCGVPSAVSLGLDALRIGGRYALTIARPAVIDIDLNRVTRKCLIVVGIHNYHPRTLGTALRFLADRSGKYPYDRIVGKVFSLSQIDEALKAAMTGEYIRVGVQP